MVVGGGERMHKGGVPGENVCMLHYPVPLYSSKFADCVVGGGVLNV